MLSLNRTLGRFASFGPLILRVTLGGLFLLHGIDKFRGGIGGVQDFFSSQGVPLASMTAPLTAVLEIVLGAALIVGLFTRVSAILLAGVLAGAIYWVKGTTILGGNELDLVYIGGLLCLALVGPGALSVDEVTEQDETIIDLRPSRTRSSVSA